MMTVRMQFFPRLSLCLGCLTLAVSTSLAHSSRDAAKAVSQLDLYPGLEATLFASEPQILSPTNIDVDHRAGCGSVRWLTTGRMPAITSGRRATEF